MTALFVPDGDALLPTDLARGPWNPAALHGGPTSALLARAVEGRAGADGLQVARLTVELLRPVPVEPLVVGAEVTRPGRKVQLVEATISHRASGNVLARARALRIRSHPIPLPDDPLVAPVPPPEPGPAGSRRERSAIADDYTAFHNTAVEHRFAAGSWLDPGPVVVWIRLLAAVVEGEGPSPLQRTVAAADFGNGVSFVLPWETHTFINPELTVHVLRPARGEWIALDAQSFIGPNGIGLAESALSDEWGRIGRASQSVLIDELEPPPG